MSTHSGTSAGVDDEDELADVDFVGNVNDAVDVTAAFYADEVEDIHDPGSRPDSPPLHTLHRGEGDPPYPIKYANTS